MRGALLAWKVRFEPFRGRARTWAAGLSLLLVLTAALSASLGSVDLPLRSLPTVLTEASHPLHGVLLDVRLPRIVGALLVGAALAVSGALMQAVVRNPLADPGLIGVTAGAGFAALLALIFWPEASLWLPAFAFAGGAVAVWALLAAAWSRGTATSPLRIILSGVAIQAILFGAIQLLTFFYADRAPSFASFVVGSLNGFRWRDAGLVLVPTALGIGAALFAARPLNLLLFDDATATGVGLSVQRARLAAASLAALLAAGAVSVAGLVAFVGLIVPNWMRLWVGPDHRSLLPLAALAGALLLLVADTVGRTVTAPLELPVGALLALLGGPYFLVILWRKLA